MRIIKNYSRLAEAVDLSKKKFKVDQINQLIQTDTPVVAWHGTSYYWAMYLCLYGIQGDVPAPSMTLGQGNSQTGYIRTEDTGLYVSPIKIKSQINFVKIEVKPSELAIPREMEGRGCTSGLDALIQEEAVIVRKLPARRITSVDINGKEYSRKQFLALEENPEDFVYVNRDKNFYHSGDVTLLGKLEKDNLYAYLKSIIAEGRSTDELVQAIDTMIKYKDYEVRSMTLRDMEEIRAWLVSKT